MGEDAAISVTAHHRRLYEIALLIGNVAQWLSNGCDPDRAAEELESMYEKLIKESERS